MHFYEVLDVEAVEIVGMKSELHVRVCSKRPLHQLRRFPSPANAGEDGLSASWRKREILAVGTTAA